MLKKYSYEISRIPKAVKRLQEVKELYLYGNSEYALRILNKMKEAHIEIKAVLVSKEYFHEDNFEGYHVYEAKSFIESSSEPITIVLGFWPLNHTKLIKELCSCRMIEHIFILEGGTYVLLNHSCFPKYIDNKVILMDDYYRRLLKRDLNREYYEENYNLFLQTYEWLADEKSRKTMGNYLNGHIELTEFPLLEVWQKEDIDNQYFPEDIIHLNEKEVFVDCGAYTGDTLEIFCKKVKHFNKYYALEPDKECFNTLHEKLIEGVVHIPAGAWDKKENLSFSPEDGGCAEVIVDGQQTDLESIACDRLDDLIDDADDVTFIKMDIEGAELRALQGASKILKKSKPKLAICIYHKREDLITIPQFIKSIVPEYKFYLRAHRPYPGEVVLYGIYDL